MKVLMTRLVPVASLALFPRMEFAAGSKVLIPSISDMLASKRQTSTNQGLVPSARKNILRSCFMKKLEPRGNV